ncbi:MAG: PQQ-binding-like beta-propeller repeat protein [Thermoanaerobaculia bacterium]
MKQRLAQFLCVVSVVGVMGGQTAKGEDPAAYWPQFRGPDRNGISRETGLDDSWPEGGPEEVWRRPVGPGFSAISVVGDRFYTAYSDDAEVGEDDELTGTEFVAAFEVATGKEIWRRDVGSKLFDEFGNGPRSTPTVDGDTLFTLTGHGSIVALGTEDGRKRWEVDVKETFGSSQAVYGFSTSVLVEDGVVITDVGGPEGKSHVGLKRETGEVLWTSGQPSRLGPGYSSVLPVDIGGRRQLIHLAGLQLRSVDTAGNEQWAIEWPRGESHSMPVFIPPDRVFASGVEGVGATVVQVKADGDGFAVEEVWKSNVMRNHFSSTLYYDDHLYGFDNATFKCVEAATGEQKWAKRGFGKGSLIYADGKLIVLSDRGRLALVKASPEAYREMGSVQALTGKSWTAPVLADGRLYLRNHTEMVSYDLRTKEIRQ